MTDAPDMFGSTYEREAARTEADWQRWIEPNPTFLFETPDARPVGLAAAVRDRDDPTVAQLVSMWVHPAARGEGAGDALVEAVITWAAEQSLPVRLWVVRENARAIRLYERAGFRMTGREVVRDRDGAVEIEMDRP